MWPVTILLCVFWLLYFTYQDYKHLEVQNAPILVFILCGLIFSYQNHNLLTLGLLGLFSFILGVFLWSKNAMGGADVKILPGIPLFFTALQFPQALSQYLFFLMLFAIVGGVYGLIAKKVFKLEKVPFLPVMALVYLIMVFYKII